MVSRGVRWILGCGYLGRRVARRWLSAGWDVHVVTRSIQKARELAAEGMVAHLADPSKKLDVAWSGPIDALLFAIGFDRSSGGTIFEAQEGGVRHVLERLEEGRVRRWIQISSTGVYGDAGGEVVDEATECHPDRDGGKASLGAERLVQGDRRAGSVTVLRLAGIYGPGRLPNAAALRRGEPLAVVAEGWLNLIHVDDAARAVELAADSSAGGLYVVSDGNPVIRGDYYREVARAYGVSEVRFAAPAEGSPRTARAGANKRIDPSKIRRELGFVPSFASYREGIAGIVASEGAQGDSD